LFHFIVSELLMDKFLGFLPKLKIILIYFLLIAGGIWNLTGMFQTLMQTISGPVIILTAFFILHEILHKKFTGIDNILEVNQSHYRNKISVFFIFMVCAGFLIEFAGVKTGYVFGRYTYGTILKPQLFEVPIAIGFAWFSTLMVSVAVMQKYIRINLRLMAVWKKSLIVGVLMMVFDYFLEHAAMNLTYWTWQIGIVPTVNYFSWFILGSLFAFIGYKSDLLNKSLPESVHHLFFAQIIFFLLSMFRI